MRLRLKIVALGLRQFEIARDTGISESRLSRFLSDQIHLTPVEIDKIKMRLRRKDGTP